MKGSWLKASHDWKGKTAPRWRSLYPHYPKQKCQECWLEPFLCTSKQKTFPAKFEDGCPCETDGQDFIEHMVHDGVVLSEGVVDIPEGHITKSQRAGLGYSDQVAFVSENKRLLFEILDILDISLESIQTIQISVPERKENQDKEVTHHYWRRKGILGCSLHLIAVTENHAKGHLHWHLM